MPRRFDRMLYLGISETHQAQLKIIEALTRKFKLEPSIRLDLVAEQCPFNYTGADFYALCSDAMLKSMSRKAEEIDAKIGEYRFDLSSLLLTNLFVHLSGSKLSTALLEWTNCAPYTSVLPRRDCDTIRD